MADENENGWRQRHEKAVGEVLSAIEKVASEVDGEDGPSVMASKAAAVKDLAEAFAWLRSANQPH